MLKEKRLKREHQCSHHDTIEACGWILCRTIIWVAIIFFSFFVFIKITIIIMMINVTIMMIGGCAWRLCRRIEASVADEPRAGMHSKVHHHHHHHHRHHHHHHHRHRQHHYHQHHHYHHDHLFKHTQRTADGSVWGVDTETGKADRKVVWQKCTTSQFI